MSIKIFFTNEIPKEREDILSIMKFSESVGRHSGILSNGLVQYCEKDIFEVWQTSQPIISEKSNNIHITKSKNYLFGSTILGLEKSFEDNKSKIIQSYKDFFSISEKNQMKIIKIWHYLPQLLEKYDNGKTNYSLLCESREVVYKKYFENFSYPAATAIGIGQNKILIYFLAALCNKYEAIENKRQVSSYKYPQDIFREKPMFSRAASFFDIDDKKEKIFISGTASIKGYKSMHSLNLNAQFDEALRNYETFIRLENNKTNISRVYVSKLQNKDLPWIKGKLDATFGSNQYILLKGDICREELLIEFEGFSDGKYKISN